MLFSRIPLMSHLSYLRLRIIPSAQDVQAALLSNKANCGLLAEPAVTATIAKAKEAGIELKVIKDLQVAYQERLNNGDFGKID